MILWTALCCGRVFSSRCWAWTNSPEAWGTCPKGFIVAGGDIGGFDGTNLDVFVRPEVGDRYHCMPMRGMKVGCGVAVLRHVDGLGD